jgi:hypothetical protein
VPDKWWKTAIAVDLLPAGIDYGVGFGKGYTLYPQDVLSMTDQFIRSIFSFFEALSPLYDLINYISTHGFHPTYDPGLLSSRDARYALLGPTIPFEYVPLTEDFDSLTWPVSGGGSIAVSNDGAVYVSQSFGLEKYDDQGDLLATWVSNGTGPGQFFGVEGLAVDSEGFVYVTDVQHVSDDVNRLQKFTSEGELVDSWNVRVKQMAINDNIVYGGVYSVYYDQHMIETYDTNGNYLGGWGTLVALGNGTTGCEDYTVTQFNSPWGLFVDADRDRLLVSDSALQDIRVMDLSGNVLAQWGHCSRSEPGLFDSPRDLVVDDEGFVYVVDDASELDPDSPPSTIKVLDPEGNYMHSWGEFDDVRSMTIDPQGYIYFVDMGNDLAYKVHSSVIKNDQEP